MTDTGNETKKQPLPPYIAFKTLVDLIERMEREEPPTRVDPTYLDSYAGGYRPTVITNLQTMDLLDKAGVPTQRLLAMIKATEAERKQLIGDLLDTLYSDVFKLGKNSTQGQFLEVFSSKGAQGDTRRKAISFFLKACSYAGKEVGTHWKTPPATSGGTSRRRTPKVADAKAKESKQDATVGDSAPDPSGETVQVDLGYAGTVTVHVNVRWLQLDDSTFVALRKAIKDIKALSAKFDASSVADGSHETQESDDE